MRAKPLRILLVALAAAVATAPGCASRDQGRSGLFEPYRIDLPQGNYVTQEMLAQVHPGLTREQVRMALGSPLLQPIFRDDRWDYVFRYKHASGAYELRRVRVIFRDNRVVAVEADSLPAREDATDPALPGYRPPPAKIPPADAKRVPANPAPPAEPAREPQR